MAQSKGYYLKNIFSSSYGENSPSFFLWYPQGTPGSEKKLLHKVRLRPELEVEKLTATDRLLHPHIRLPGLLFQMVGPVELEQCVSPISGVDVAADNSLHTLCRFVSGMREDLGMLGTEYNLAVTCFQIGQILGPSGLQTVIRISFTVSSNY